MFKNLTKTNGLRIKAHLKHGRIIIRGLCRAPKGKFQMFEIPAEYGMYWYPLPFYLDYYYKENFHTIVLHIDHDAPSVVFDQFGKKKYYFLHDFYNYKRNRFGKDQTMYLINLELTTKLKSMGLKTWDTLYNLQDVSRNFEQLSNSLTSTENKITKREIKAGKDPNKVRNNPLDYATDKELSYLSDLGLGYRMTSYMSKVAKVMYLGEDK